MTRRLALLRLAAALAPMALGACAPGGAPSSSGGQSATGGRTASVAQVGEERLRRLARGVNLSHWFAQGPGTPEHLQTTVTFEDARRIRRMGFRHVRLPLDPVLLYRDDAPDALLAENLYYLDDALRMLAAEDLAVVVDLHPEDAFKRGLASDAAFAERVVRFWAALARHLNGYGPEFVFLEALNEPRVEDVAAWAALQGRLLAAMRQGAPRHTLIATGGGWSAVADLMAVQPVADRNVAYTFHYYEPYAFTHQGASWGRDATGALGGVPYPLTPATVGPVLPRLPDERTRALVRSMAEPAWDAARVEGVIEQAAAWGRRHGVPVTCSEFGVYRPVAPPDGRVAWLRDVRAALDVRGIGWTHWDYAGGFGVVDGGPGRRVIDSGTALALAANA